MARFRRLDVLGAMVSSGLVPVFTHRDAEVALKVAAACAEGGSRILEFTNRGDRAIDVFSALVARCEKEIPDMILGVGSVMDAPTAALYLAAGANFIVGPNLNAEVARIANRRKVAYCPGCGTVSEISNAEELGCEIVKIFPGDSIGGPAFVEAVRGPCPWTSIMPTGGVEPTEESVTAWIRAGVACLGMGSKLIAKDVLARGDYGEITRRVRHVLGLIAKARGKA